MENLRHLENLSDLCLALFAEEEEAWGEAGLSKVTEVSGKATPGGEAP